MHGKILVFTVEVWNVLVRILGGWNILFCSLAEKGKGIALVGQDLFPLDLFSFKLFENGSHSLQKRN
jgi:hypothetical protein